MAALESGPRASPITSCSPVDPSWVPPCCRTRSGLFGFQVGQAWSAGGDSTGGSQVPSLRFACVVGLSNVAARGPRKGFCEGRGVDVRATSRARSAPQRPFTPHGDELAAAVQRIEYGVAGPCGPRRTTPFHALGGALSSILLRKACAASKLGRSCSETIAVTSTLRMITRTG